MEYGSLGQSDLTVSRLCLGMMSFGSNLWRDWVLNENDSLALIGKAISLGINFFDTANVYSHGISEEITGKAIREYARREDVVIATKVFYPLHKESLEEGLSRQAIRKAVHGSLERLQTDYIDLYQIHRWDYHTPIEETMEALDELVQEGKIRYIGASSMYAWQFAKANFLAQYQGKSTFLTMQNHYNLVFREEEREMIPLCEDLGVALLPWSPLARGFLSRKKSLKKNIQTKREKSDLHAHNMYYQENDYEILDRVYAVAEIKETTPAQIALAWLLHKPYVAAPILGITKEEHLLEGIKALDIPLSKEEISILEELYRPHPIVTFDMDRNNPKKEAVYV